MTIAKISLQKILLPAAAIAGLLAAGGALWLSHATSHTGDSSLLPRQGNLTGSGNNEDDEGSASDPVDLISAIDLEVGVIDGASDLDVIEKDYDCLACKVQAGKLEVSQGASEKPRMIHNTYDDGSHCSFDETYYLALDGMLLHAVTLESCWEFAPGRSTTTPSGAEVPPVTIERWDETRTYFRDDRALKSQRRSGAAREELDGTPWEDDVAPVGEMLPKRARALLEFFASDDDYETFFEGGNPP